MSKISVDESLSPSVRTELFIAAIQQNLDDIGLVQILTNDFISPQHNLENFVNEIISLFSQFQDTKIKNQLLRGLAVTYSYHLAEKTDKKSFKKAKKIQNLFLEQVKLKKGGTLLTSLAYLPTIFSYKETKDIIRTIDIKLLSLVEQQQVENIVVLIALNYLNSSVNQWDIFWKQYTDEQKKVYTKSMYKMLAMPGLVALFDKEQKNALQEYLIKNWPVSFEDKTRGWVYDMRLWFIALLNLQDAEVQGRETAMNCLLTKHPNIQERSIYMDQFYFTFSEENAFKCPQYLSNSIKNHLSSE
jgi:hypothetical protein